MTKTGLNSRDPKVTSGVSIVAPCEPLGPGVFAAGGSRRVKAEQDSPPPRAVSYRL